MRTIERQALRRAIDSDRDFVLINVLNEKAFAEKHIPGSYNIPAGDDDFLQKVENCVQSKLDPIVVYCSGYDCSASARAAEILENAGYSHVRAYEGGMEDWEDAELPVARGHAARHRAA